MGTYANLITRDVFCAFYDATTEQIKTHTTPTIMATKEGNLIFPTSTDITFAVLSNTSNTAFQVVFETIPFEVSGVNWSVFHTMNFGDDGGIVAPKFQTVTIPGRFGKIRARLISITGGSVEIYAIA